MMRSSTAHLFAAILSIMVPLDGFAGETNSPGRQLARLPGLHIDVENRYVDIDAVVCLHDGLLELIACTKGGKEHESIVAITARPVHVHTALLLLGAESGHPALREPVDEERTRWVSLPPRGDPVEVFFVVENHLGKKIERRISDFVAPAEPDFPADADDAPADAEMAFANNFVFAGSRIHETEEGKSIYLADRSGNVISVVTFGDELLCLPEVRGRDNEALMWQVNPDLLPAVGEPITLRLRPGARDREPAPPDQPETTR